MLSNCGYVLDTQVSYTVHFTVKSTYSDYIISIKLGREKELGDTDVVGEEMNKSKTKIGHKERQKGKYKQGWKNGKSGKDH